MQTGTSMADYRRAWRERFRRNREQTLQNEAAARRELPHAVEVLCSHGATRIWLFGSLASEGRFRPGSDIDLAVEGIPPTRIDRALADLMVNLDHPVDLKPIEDLDDHFRASVLRRGICIHGSAR